VYEFLVSFRQGGTLGGIFGGIFGGSEELELGEKELVFVKDRIYFFKLQIPVVSVACVVSCVC
jgi:hypothetical protein